MSMATISAPDASILSAIACSPRVRKLSSQRLRDMFVDYYKRLDDEFAQQVARSLVGEAYADPLLVGQVLPPISEEAKETAEVMIHWYTVHAERTRAERAKSDKRRRFRQAAIKRAADLRELNEPKPDVATVDLEP